MLSSGGRSSIVCKECYSLERGVLHSGQRIVALWKECYSLEGVDFLVSYLRESVLGEEEMEKTLQAALRQLISESIGKPNTRGLCGC